MSNFEQLNADDVVKVFENFGLTDPQLREQVIELVNGRYSNIDVIQNGYDKAILKVKIQLNRG